jgi:putative lipoprotein
VRFASRLAFATTLSASLLVPQVAAADEDDFWGRDKALHFGVSVALASGTYAVSASFFEARYPPLLLGAGVSLGLGVGKELADLAGLGTPSWKDLAWDAIGTVTGLVLAYGIDLAIRGVSAEHPAFGSPEPIRTVRPAFAPMPQGLVLRF